MRRRFSELAATSPKMNGGKMADRLKFALLSLLVALVTFVAAPIAKADAWDKETIVTFSSPVEVPGQVLPPGTYVFKRAHSEWDRDIVQIFTKDQRNLLATAGLNRSEEHTSELQSLAYLVCRLLLEKKNSDASRFTRRLSAQDCQASVGTCDYFAPTAGRS